jgi:hypothetical protein
MWIRKPLPPEIAAGLARLLASLERHDRRVLDGSSPLVMKGASLPRLARSAAQPGCLVPALRDKPARPARRRSIDQANAELADLARAGSSRSLLP